MGLPNSTIINVSITKVPTGQSNVAVNNLAIFTNDTVSFNGDIFRTYVDSQSVAADCGADSLTTQMAENIFAQTPNILTGDGSLQIIPLLSSVSATSGAFTTANISANLANFIAVTDGAFKISINGGTATQYGDFNFTNCTTLQHIADVIQKKVHDVIVTVATDTLVFTSKKFGTVSTVAFSAPTGGTSLIGSNYLNTSAGSATIGVASSGETIKQAVARTQGDVFYEGILDTLYLEDSIRELDAAYCQSIGKLYMVASATTEDIAGFATTASTAKQDKVRTLLYSVSPEASKLKAASYAGRAFSIDFSGSNTVHTMHLKALVNVTPDPLFDGTDNITLKNSCEAAGVDFYTNFSGVPGCCSTGGNDYFDNIISDIWLKFAIEVAGFNHLQETNTKVPQTEKAMDGYKGALEQVLIQGVANGAYAAGEWNSSQTFGDPATFKQNIKQKGYYIYSAPISTQSQTDRNNRKAPLVQIAAKRAGAIHSGSVIVIIEN